MIARRLFLLVFSGALLAAFGCSSSSDTLALRCTDLGAAPSNTISLSCAGATSGTTEQLDVVLGGPASGVTNLSGLNFDVTYDPTKMAIVPTGPFTSPLFPDALIVARLYNGQPGRLVVSIQQPGGLPPVDVAPGQHDVLSFSFSRASTTAFNPTALLFENAEATSASSPVTFVSNLAISYL